VATEKILEKWACGKIIIRIDGCELWHMTGTRNCPFPRAILALCQVGLV